MIEPRDSERIERPIEMSKFHEIELEYIFDSVNSTRDRRLQMGSFFGTANLAIVSVGFTSKLSSLFLLAGLMLIILSVIDSMARAWTADQWVRIIQLHNTYHQTDEEFFENNKNSLSFRSAKSTIDGRPVGRLYILFRSKIGFWMVGTAAIAELACGFLFWQVFGWPLI